MESRGCTAREPTRHVSIESVPLFPHRALPATASDCRASALSPDEAGAGLRAGAAGARSRNVDCAGAARALVSRRAPVPVSERRARAAIGVGLESLRLAEAL